MFSTDLPPKNSVVREGALVETVVDLPLLPRRGALGLWVSGTDESVQEPLAAKPVDHQPAHQARIKAVSFIPPVLLAYIEGLALLQQCCKKRPPRGPSAKGSALIR